MPTFVAKSGQQTGPFEDQEILTGLAGGRFSAEDLAWREGMAGWQQLRDLYPAVMGSAEPPSLPVKPQLGDDFGTRLLLPVGRSGWAIAAGYLGLFSLIILPAPISLVVSVIAIRDIRKSRTAPHPKHGMGRAIFGLIMGVLGTGVIVFAVIAGILSARH